jgi:hypothetical protein
MDGINENVGNNFHICPGMDGIKSTQEQLTVVSMDGGFPFFVIPEEPEATSGIS